MRISQNRFPLQEGDLLPLSDIMERWQKSCGSCGLEHDAIQCQGERKMRWSLIGRWNNRNIKKCETSSRFFNANSANQMWAIGCFFQQCEDLTPEVVRADTPLLRCRVGCWKGSAFELKENVPYGNTSLVKLVLSTQVLGMLKLKGYLLCTCTKLNDLYVPQVLWYKMDHKAVTETTGVPNHGDFSKGME